NDLYRAVDAWIGHIKGGLAITTIGTSALFAAISGSVNATTATMAQIALPEMNKYIYDQELSTSCVAAGGTLGILIHPSGILILYGILTMEPIDKLLIAGLIPGLLQMILFMLAIYVIVSRYLEKAPVTAKKSFKMKLKSLNSVWHFILFFALSFCGIYFVFFTLAVAGCIVSSGFFLFSIFITELSWNDFKISLNGTANLTVMIFFILIVA